MCYKYFHGDINNTCLFSSSHVGKISNAIRNILLFELFVVVVFFLILVNVHSNSVRIFGKQYVPLWFATVRNSMKLITSYRRNELLLRIWNQDAITVVSLLMCTPFLFFVKYFMCEVFNYNSYRRCKINKMHILNVSDRC